MAAGMGHSPAKYELARLWEARGDRSGHSPGEIGGLYQEAAVWGHSLAQYALARRYETGEGVERDTGMAVELYRRASGQGNKKAAARLAELSPDREADTRKAFELARDAAGRGDPAGMYDLARCYELGRGVYQDLNTAESYYRQAAAKGHVPARQKLAQWKR